MSDATGFDLGPLEAEVMRLVWERGEVQVEGRTPGAAPQPGDCLHHRDDRDDPPDPQGASDP